MKKIISEGTDRTMETIEDVILKHSGRGMHVLREYLEPDYCHSAAREILSWERGNVILTTGFYVAGRAETDGPSGTVALARALREIGFHPVILTDEYCRGFFEPEQLDTVYMKLTDGETFCRDLLARFRPVGLISIERCGRNAQGVYANMRGLDISSVTAHADLLFRMSAGKTPTIGVGDGGNEIGMGNLADVIEQKLSLAPSSVRCDHLVIASVSNWGAYGMAACLSELTGRDLLSSFEEIRDYIRLTVKLGSVDGITHEQIMSVDGHDLTVGREIIEDLKQCIHV